MAEITFTDLTSFDPRALRGQNLRHAISETLARATPAITHTGIRVTPKSDQTDQALVEVRTPSANIVPALTVAKINAAVAAYAAEQATKDAERASELAAAQTDAARLFEDVNGLRATRALLVSRIDTAFPNASAGQRVLLLALAQGVRLA